ncbi:hypothetical protein CASFOL_016590 [Castilleja foliolosa]|uniref:non-specific serine/threonine protein kinase n=1 Tax=Castilleja foliolosa TaxID=1961234 RepID=A0ABD3D8M8_9LAMI
MEIFTCFFSFALITFNSFLTLTLSKPTFFNFTTDQNALIAFKNTISVDGLVLKQNWSTNTSVCYWIGVSCGPKHQRVTALNVSGLELKGTIAPHLGNLTFLRSLDISSNNLTASNQLTGPIPNGMFSIPSLVNINMIDNRLSGKLPNDLCNTSQNLIKTIYLYDNQLHGQIPGNIFKCSQLEELDLDNNHFNGNIPIEISSAPMLRILSLQSNQLQGGNTSFLFNISSIRVMDLSYNSLFGSIPTDTLYNLPEIQELYLANVNLTGGIPTQFGNLTSLTMLDLSYNKLTGELPVELGNLAYLEVLAAPYNDLLSGPIPSSIFNLSALSVLALQQNLFSGSLPSDMGLSVFSLKKLILSMNRLTGEIPSCIANASELTKLVLNKNFLSGPIPNFGTLTNLQFLRLWENNLTGTGFLSSLTSCRYLENLEITHNPLNGILPTSVGNLSTSLDTILASGCKIHGIIPSEIGNLKSLQSLDLSGNQLTGFIPATMGGLNQLYVLDLDRNRLRGYIPRDLCQLSHLGQLYLYNNMLTGPIPDCIGQLESLTEVYCNYNKLNSTIPSGLWNLKGLIMLDLSVNSFGGQLSPQIGNLNSLSILDLSHNQFTGDIPSSIDGCRSLQSLNLSNNNFSGSIPESLGTNLRGLGTLNLSNNRLSGLIPKSLENVRGLRYFDVSYNELDGEIPNGGPFVNFTAQSFAHNSALCGNAKLEVPTCPESRGRSRSKRITRIIKYVVPTFVSTIILIVVILIFIRRRKRGTITPPPADISLKTIACRRFSYIELDRGTSSFSELNLLGRGGFGSVFKATLSDGLDIAVKVFNLQLEAATKSFDTESEILSSIRHRNLVPVIGCCANTEFRALILEYMQNGSLEKWLHSENYCLDLVQRLSIATDVALALEYLHHGHTYPVVHCDIKPSNVLLDEDMTAHVGDFGISKLFDEGETMIQTTTVATIGYAAPEYGSEGKVSTKGDVYSYGIMLLEMFTRKRPTDDMFSTEMSLKEWVRENGATEVIVAPGLLLSREDQHFSAHEQCVSSVFDLAMKCLAFLLETCGPILISTQTKNLTLIITHFT